MASISTRCRGSRARCIAPAKPGGGSPLASSLYPLRCCCCIVAFPIASTSSRRLGEFWRSATAWRRWSGRHIRQSTDSRGTATNQSPAPLPSSPLAERRGSFLCWWCRPIVMPPPYLWFSVGMPWLAAIVAAAVESIPIRLDDNLSVPAAAGAGVVAARRSSVEDLAIGAMSQKRSGVLPLAVAVNVAVPLLGYLARTVTISGAICRRDHRHRHCRRRRMGRVDPARRHVRVRRRQFTAGSPPERHCSGIAEAKGGRRGAGNAIREHRGGGGGRGLGCAHLRARRRADCICRRARSRRQRHGGERDWQGLGTTDDPAAQPSTESRLEHQGAVSAEGTAAGLIGALALSALGAAVGLIPFSALPPSLLPRRSVRSPRACWDRRSKHRACSITTC